MVSNSMMYEGTFDAIKAQKITGAGINYVSSILMTFGGPQSNRKRKIKKLKQIING